MPFRCAIETCLARRCLSMVDMPRGIAWAKGWLAVVALPLALCGCDPTPAAAGFPPSVGLSASAGSYQLYVPLCSGETLSRVLVEGNSPGPSGVKLPVVWDVSRPRDATQRNIVLGASDAFESVETPFDSQLPSLINVSVYTSEDRDSGPRFANTFALVSVKTTLNGGHNLNFNETTEADLNGLACDQ